MKPEMPRLRGLGRVLVPAFFLVAISALVALEIYALVVTHTEGFAPLPTTFGNFERVRKLLGEDEEDDAFSFAVVGDTQGCGTFERIAEDLKDEPLSFMVLLGDCVREGTVGQHRYFRAELSTELVTRYPVFYVVGNHDVDPQGFPLSEFERTYGPANFFFEYRNYLFIFLRTLPEYPMDETVGFLDRVLSAHRRDSEKVFVFMHIPPIHALTFSARDSDGKEALVALFDEYDVDYVCAGDYHGYARAKLNGTVYLVTGGGGAHLKEGKFGAFHHALVLRVEPSAVHERLLFVVRNEDLEDRLERFALAEVYPWLSANRVSGMALNAGVLALAAWAIRRLVKTRRSGFC